MSTPGQGLRAERVSIHMTNYFFLSAHSVIQSILVTAHLLRQILHTHLIEYVHIKKIFFTSFVIASKKP